MFERALELELRRERQSVDGMHERLVLQLEQAADGVRDVAELAAGASALDWLCAELAAVGLRLGSLADQLELAGKRS